MKQATAIELFLQKLTFKKRALGGCDEEDVLLRIKELSALYQGEFDRLTQRLAAADGRLAEYEQQAEKVRQLLASAQTVKEAEQEKGRIEAAALNAEAKQKAAALIQQTTLEAESVLVQARIEAEKLVDEARKAVEEQLNSVQGEADKKRGAAERETAELRTTAKRETAELRATAERETAELRANAERTAEELRTTAERETDELRATAAREVEEYTAHGETIRTELSEQVEQAMLILGRVEEHLRKTTDLLGSVHKIIR